MNLLTANDRQGSFPASYYAATATDRAPAPPLRGSLRADVCVVGGGYTGLSAALHLAERGYSVVLLEAHRAGFGASGRNGGQVGSGQRLEQDELERRMGRDDAHRLWAIAEEAKALVRDLITRHAMPVPFRPGVAHACRTEAEVRHSHAMAEKLAREYGYDQVEPLDKAGIRGLIGSDDYVGGDIDRGAGHIHPLNFAIGLAQAAQAAGVTFHENTLVTGITRGQTTQVMTAKGSVTADHVILACNGYLGDLVPEVAARVMPINNFIIATEPLGAGARDLLAEAVAVADTRFVVNYWRLSEDNRLLFGGGESFGYRFPDVIATVRKPMLKVYPQLRDVRIDYAWGGTLAITMNRMPHFARPAPNCLSAGGYSGHGVALATLAGRLMADAVAGQSHGFDTMAAIPTRSFPGGTMLRSPLLVAGMAWYGLRDRLGF